MKALAFLTAPKNLTIILVFLVLIFLGLWAYNKGKKASKCPWYKFGFCSEEDEEVKPEDNYVADPVSNPTAFDPAGVANKINHALQRLVSSSSLESAAFAAFNFLTMQQKLDVVNYWNQTIKGQDRYGYFTGDIDTLRKEMEWHNSDSLTTEGANAYHWLLTNGIN